MSRLGDVLEKIFSVEPPFQTLAATIRESGRPSKKPENETLTYQVWSIYLDRVRVEGRIRHHGVRNMVKIINGSRQIIQIDSGECEAKQLDGISFPTEFARHFYRHEIKEYLRNMEMKDVGDREVAGRSCVEVVSNISPGGRLWPHWLPYEATEYRIAFDEETGCILRIEGIYEEVAPAIIEVISIEFNGMVDKSLFKIDATKPGITQVKQVPKIDTLEDARLVVPFPIYLPTRFDSDPEVLRYYFFAPKSLENKHPYLAINMATRHWSVSISINPRETRAGRLPRGQFVMTELNLDGNKAVIMNPTNEFHSIVIEFEDVIVRIDSSHFGMGELTEIARTLKRHDPILAT